MNIAVAGFGIEGKASYDYYTRRGDSVTILDENTDLSAVPDGARTVLGPEAFSNLADYDLVLRTPPLPPSRLAHAKKVWSGTNEFFAQCPAPIIGVTGTKGKGTTSSLIASILRAAGKTVHLVGNIGTPALQALPAIAENDIVVYELSSFQLWDAEFSPGVAVVLMVEPDHLNVHRDFEDYVYAKAHITMHQKPSDTVIYHPTDPNSLRIAQLSPADTKLRYLTAEAAYVDKEEIVMHGKVVCNVRDVHLLGAYNLENVCAAISAAMCFVKDRAIVQEAVSNFTALPHRLERIAQKADILYYDDSFAAAPTATLGAIEAFDRPIVLIIGGVDRNLDLREMVVAISNNVTVKNVIVIGETRHKIAVLFDSVNYEHYIVCESRSMDEIVQLAAKLARPGDVVLLSPGAASFDMFSGFVDRGNQFRLAVEKL